MTAAGVVAVRIGIALGIGLLIGAERERRKGQGSQRAPAGIRTFTIASLLGAVSEQLGGEGLLAVVILAMGGLMALSYLRTYQQDPGVTTESALLVTVLLGALAMREPAIASGAAVIVAILLAARLSLHRFVRSVLTEQELHDALVFAAAVVVILPLIPNRYVGPFSALNPRTIWKIVVLMMSVSASGYIAVRGIGARLGLPLAGFASGFASSTATIAAMGARVREHPALTWPATAGAALSSVATVTELAIVLGATSPSLLWATRFPLIAAGIVAAVYAAIITLRTSRRRSTGNAPPGSAFNLMVTFILALTLTVVVFLSAILHAMLGRKGLLVASAVAGFADAHAAAISVASLVTAGKLNASDAVVPVLAGLTANVVTKAVLAFTAGGKSFAIRVCLGLLLMTAAVWMAFLMSI